MTQNKHKSYPISPEVAESFLIPLMAEKAIRTNNVESIENFKQIGAIREYSEGVLGFVKKMGDTYYLIPVRV